MGRDRPIVHCLSVPIMRDGRIRGKVLRVSLETAEWLLHEHGWAVVGPDPEEMNDLAAWEREQMPTRRTT